MLRNIIKIDKDKCNGCGLCVLACQEGAIGLVDGKAELLRDDYCDGLGNCLPVCPTEAISFEEREASPFDEAAVLKNMEAGGAEKAEAQNVEPLPCGCPGTHAKAIVREVRQENAYQGDGTFDRGTLSKVPSLCKSQAAEPSPHLSELMQWPVQIKLVPVNAPYFQGAKLLVSADCAAYAYGNFHSDFMKNKVCLIGCPKLDEGDYSDKLTEIIRSNDIKSVTVVRMEVPCCGGIENAVKEALKRSEKMIPWQIVTISTDGRILD